MNKTEFIAAVADKAEISKKDSEKALKAFVDVVTEQLKAGDKVQLVGFGTFEVSERAARESLEDYRLDYMPPWCKLNQKPSGFGKHHSAVLALNLSLVQIEYLLP